jgi:hypothetical protein
MDAAGVGSVSFEEFQHGLESCPEFGRALDTLEIDVRDICAVFEIMGQETDSGRVTYDEFSDCLLRITKDETHMLLLFMKHFMGRLEHQMVATVRKHTEVNDAKADKLRNEMQSLVPFLSTAERSVSSDNLVQTAREPKDAACLAPYASTRAVATLQSATVGAHQPSSMMQMVMTSTMSVPPMPPPMSSSHFASSQCEAPTGGQQLADLMLGATTRLEALAAGQQGQLDRLAGLVDAQCPRAAREPSCLDIDPAHFAVKRESALEVSPRLGVLSKPNAAF